MLLSQLLLATALISALSFIAHWPGQLSARRTRVALGLHLCLTVIQLHMGMLVQHTEGGFLFFRAHIPFLYFTGPMAYLYFRELFQREQEVLQWRRLFLHLAPGIMAAFLLVPYYLSSPAVKQRLWLELVVLKHVSFSDFILLTGMVSLLVYLLVTLWQFRRLLLESYNKKEYLTTLAGLTLLLGIACTAGPLVSLVSGQRGFIYFSAWGLVIIVAGNLIFQMRFPGFVRDVRYSLQKDRPATENGIDADDPRIRRILERIDVFIEEQGYLDDDISLTVLADRMDVPAHLLSQVINSCRRQSFFQFIHELRINHACRLLKEDSRRTVLSIAYECGFNTKSSFNAAFLKVTGLTPSQYRGQSS